MTRMTGPDCAVMCNFQKYTHTRIHLMNTHTNTHAQTHIHTQTHKHGGGGRARNEDKYENEHECRVVSENRSGKGDKNRDEGRGEREPGNLQSGRVGLEDARGGATPTSNQEPRT